MPVDATLPAPCLVGWVLPIQVSYPQLDIVTLSAILLGR
jgi:hypothetical protein